MKSPSALPYYVENVLRDGHIYAVSHRPMPEGGWVATHIDITEQRRAEQELDETRKFLGFDHREHSGFRRRQGRENA